MANPTQISEFNSNAEKDVEAQLADMHVKSGKSTDRKMSVSPTPKRRAAAEKCSELIKAGKIK